MAAELRAGEPASPAPAEPSAPHRAWRSARTTAARHPVLTIAALAVVVGALNLAWTVAHRRPGGLDVDEVGYLTQAFRWQRMVDPAHPFAVYSSVLDQDKGPITMLVSVMALLVGPNTVATAMSASAILHGVSAAAVAGITNRLAGARAAIVAGLVVLALPAALLTARSYQLAPAVAAALTCAVWAVLASDRGRRLLPMLAFGIAVGALMLSRTMAIAFVPGLLVAAALHVDWTRQVVRNAVAAIAVAALVAVPWWWSQREPILDYLLGHGYGEAAEGYGPGNLVVRIPQRLLSVLGSTGLLFFLLTVLVMVLAAVQARRRHGRPTWAMFRSNAAVVWLPVGAGMAALMSTANMGMYFELPLIVLGVAGVAALGAGLSPPAPRWLGTVAVALSVLTLGASLLDSGGKRVLSRPADFAQSAFFPGLANFQRPTIEAEPRLGSTRRDDRREAMREWWEATRVVVRSVDEQSGGSPVVQTVCGSGAQLSANSLTLAGEMDGRLQESSTHWLRTTAAPAEMEAQMQPWAEGKRRIVVLIDSEAEPFPGETTVDQCAATAAAMGWDAVSSIDLPDGGTAQVMVHPER